MVLCAGCLNLKLGQEMVPDEDDWAMEGASALRQNVSPVSIDPPLYEKWRYDAGAGVGPAGALIVDDIVILGNRKGMVHGIRMSDGKRMGRIKHNAPIEGGMAMGEGMLFLPMAGDKRSVVAYKLWDGKKQWARKGLPVEAGLIYTDGKVIAVDNEANVYALDPKSGDVLWETLLDEQTTVVASPIVVDEQLYVIDERGILYAMSIDNGEIYWEQHVGAPVYNTAASDGRRLFVPTTRGRLFALDVRDGRELWDFALADTTVRFSTPAYSPQTKQLAVSATNGEVRMLDAATGDVQWDTLLDGAISTPPLITNQTIYVGTMRRMLHALDAETGIEIWSHEVNGRVKSAVTAHGTNLIVMAETQQVISFTPEAPVTEDEETP
ncbi:MAG: PQQ-binding-like beta-propeller repeat protein [Bacteroidota bacterium]